MGMLTLLLLNFVGSAYCTVKSYQDYGPGYGSGSDGGYSVGYSGGGGRGLGSGGGAERRGGIVGGRGVGGGREGGGGSGKRDGREWCTCRSGQCIKGIFRLDKQCILPPLFPWKRDTCCKVLPGRVKRRSYSGAGTGGGVIPRPGLRQRSGNPFG